MSFVHIATGNSQEEAVSRCQCTACVCVRLHCHSVFPPALKKILPTAPFSAGGSVGRCEEEKT